jgi:hypothetical protein
MGKMITNLGFIKILGEAYLETSTADIIKAFGAGGLQLQDDGGNLGIFIEDGGCVFIGTAVTNAKMTIGLTINQAGNDDEILAFKSSDVAHGMTDLMETDTYAMLAKSSATVAGLEVRVCSTTNYSLILRAIATTVDTTKSVAGVGPIMLDAGIKSGTTWGTMTADGNLVVMRNQTSARWILDEDGDTWQSGDLFLGTNATGVFCRNNAGNDDLQMITLSGADAVLLGENDIPYVNCRSSLFFVEETVNTKMTRGITINQGSNDDEILAFKSSDIAHGMTNTAETDTYAHAKKFASDSGGLLMRGWSEGTEALVMYAAGTTGDTTKSGAAVGAIIFRASQKDGVGLQAMGANENLMVIQNHASTKWILDEDGDTWQNGNIHADVAAGAYLYLERSDTSVQSGEVYGSVQFLCNDAQVSTEPVAFEIVCTAEGAIGSDVET